MTSLIPNQPRQITVPMIAQAVAQVTNIPLAEIASNRRHRRLWLSRRVLVLLARKYTILGYADITIAMGKRGTAHSTVIGIFNKATEILALPAHDPERVELVETIEKVEGVLRGILGVKA